jgi:Protein of unknown function (DUF3221)
VRLGLRRSGTRCLAALAALGIAFASPAMAHSPDNGVRGVVTEVSRSAEFVVVEEDPSDRSGSAKGEFAVTEETEILEQRDGDLAPAPFEALRVGQTVEATYAGPVVESYPTQGVAGRIVILAESRGDAPAALPDTGGAPALALGVSLIACGLLVRYSLR